MFHNHSKLFGLYVSSYDSSGLAIFFFFLNEHMCWQDEPGVARWLSG